MGIIRKYIRIELICLLIDKSKNYHDPEYINILVDDYGIVPFAIFEEEDFSLDKRLRSLYNEYISIDFDWTTKYLADVHLSENYVSIRYIIRMPRLENAILKGKLVTTYDFLEKMGDESYDRIISG